MRLRDALIVGIAQIGALIPGSEADVSVQDHSWFAYLHMRDANGLYVDVVAKEVRIWHPCKTNPGACGSLPW